MPTARNLFPFVNEGAPLTTTDGTAYIVSGDEQAGRYFLRAGAFDAEVQATEDGSDFADWCSRYAPTATHEAELELAVNELDLSVGCDVDADILKAVDAWIDQGGAYAIVAVDVDAIAAGCAVRPSFVAARARALGVSVL